MPKIFPIHSSDRKRFRESVPWEFAERFRTQIEKNHSQSLETLASRGGLSAAELYVASQKKRLIEVDWNDSTLTTKAINHLAKQLRNEITTALWTFELNVTCPHCKEEINLLDHPDFWEDKPRDLSDTFYLKSQEAYCPECETEFICDFDY